MDRITATQVFIEIVERGSLTAAADHLGMSRAMVTRYLSELEDWTGTRLLQRSTRRISLTSAGEALLVKSRLLQELVDEIESHPESKGVPRGKISVTASASLAHSHLTKMMAQFIEAYPKTSIDLIVGDKSVNLIESRVDLAIRISSKLDGGFFAKKIGVCKSVICATPQYVKRFGKPKTLEDLSKHNCLTHSHVAKIGWHFYQGDQEKIVRVSGNLTSNETTVLLKGVKENLGIAVLPHYLIQMELDSGELVPLFEDWDVEEFGIYAVYLSKKFTPPAVRVLIDFLSEKFKLAGLIETSD